MNKDFDVYSLHDLPDGRCAVMLYGRSFEDVIKQFGDVPYDNMEDIKIFPTRKEANAWRTKEILTRIDKTC